MRRFLQNLLLSGGTPYVPTPTPSFAPTDISGLKLWLKADQISGSDGDAVGTWSDQSGNGYNLTQGTAANKPTLKTNIKNGRSIVRFDGTNDYMDGTTITNIMSTTTLSAYIVVNVKAYTTNTANGYDNDTIFTETTGGNLSLYTRSTGVTGIEVYDGAQKQATKTTVADTWYVIHIRRDSGTTYISVNNGSESSVAAGAASFIPGNIRFGTNYAAAVADFIQMDLAEVVMYNTAVGSSDRTSLQTYLNGRWAVY
jgi:hypothetical protein